MIKALSSLMLLVSMFASSAFAASAQEQADAARKVYSRLSFRMAAYVRKGPKETACKQIASLTRAYKVFKDPVLGKLVNQADPWSHRNLLYSPEAFVTLNEYCNGAASKKDAIEAAKALDSNAMLESSFVPSDDQIIERNEEDKGLDDAQRIIDAIKFVNEVEID